jgi:hypothetical protein
MPLTPVAGSTRGGAVGADDEGEVLDDIARRHGVGDVVGEDAVAGDYIGRA